MSYENNRPRSFPTSVFVALERPAAPPPPIPILRQYDVEEEAIPAASPEPLAPEPLTRGRSDIKNL